MRTTISPEPALLGFLRQAPLHGYDLYKQVSAQLGPVWHLGQSQMYAILKEYEARGWVRTIWQTQGGRPPRKVLELTPAGSQAFDAWMAQSARGLRELRVDFLARLYFARTQGKQPLRQLLDRQIQATRRELDNFRAADQNSSEFTDLVRNFRVEQLYAILQWLEETRRKTFTTRPLLKRKRTVAPHRV